MVQTSDLKPIGSYQCPEHPFCVDNIARNTKEICWMRKLMMGTLVTGLFTLVGVIVTLVTLAVKLGMIH